MPASPKFVDGVEVVIFNGNFFFSKREILKRFGIHGNSKLAKAKPLHQVKMPDGSPALSFPELLELVKELPDVPMEFVNQLICLVKTEPVKVRRKGQPNFNDPSAAAKAWAAEHEARLQAERDVEQYKELLGDGVEYKIVHAISWLDEIFIEDRRNIMGPIALRLRRISQEQGLPIKQCKAFGYMDSLTRGMYHVKAIAELRRELKIRKDLFHNYRKDV